MSEGPCDDEPGGAGACLRRQHNRNRKVKDEEELL